MPYPKLMIKNPVSSFNPHQMKALSSEIKAYKSSLYVYAFIHTVILSSF